jgi:N-methylhydantoinase A/oxoprolinase/acetone carboxylase beta subunit
MSARWRIGFDIGGTFTDFILADAQAGSIRLHKCLTTPADPSVGALAGLAELTAAAGIALPEVAEIIHGTTLVTNAIIERKGAPVGLITTQGFRDLLEMGTEQRYDIYDLFLRYPEPLVARRAVTACSSCRVRATTARSSTGNSDCNMPRPRSSASISGRLSFCGRLKCDDCIEACPCWMSSCTVSTHPAGVS